MRDARRTKRSLPGTARVLLALIVLSAWPAFHADPSASSSVERDTNSHRLQALERRGERLEASFVAMERSARRFHRWLGCISLLPVDEVGDPNHRFGFAYDEMDGTKLDHRPAFVVGDRHERTDYHVLTFAHRDECQSHPTRPGTPGHPGTARPRSHGTAGTPRSAVAEAGAVGGGPVEAGACASIACLGASTSGNPASPWSA